MDACHTFYSSFRNQRESRKALFMNKFCMKEGLGLTCSAEESLDGNTQKKERQGT